jgi:hypothetical protein
MLVEHPVHCRIADRWANLYYGLYAYRTARHEGAVTAFSVCIGADGTVAGHFYTGR